ncbi:MAG TPA: Na+/H+ antiporter [Nocardioides sp.]|uniref:Na+/H+ antiporter n=1 Tax=Nocardioides sp. TaxID=35761 RepID=UPI002CB8DB4D|nr:Na+/H+ antiporter [Nocardioides sp.]HTW14287.1 Na+/H+ antiporter [Nocardioides sp.]
MDVALLLCGLAVGVLVCTEVARRIDVPAPFLLIAVGVAASYVPQVPQVYLDHDVVLLGLLPPLLYAAAQQTSLVDFNANRRPILALSVGLVIFTAAGVAVVVHLLLPGISWAVAFAIGAVVAPPDAVAATAIARRIGLPRRIVTILEGESLVNDATALVGLRTALAVAAGTGLDAWEVSLDFVRAAGGGVLVGIVFFVVVAKVRRWIDDPVTDSAISLVVPFAAYVLAEELHASGVLAVVIAGLLLGHKAPVLQSAQSRIAERLNWRTIAFVLENTVFLLIGLQAWWIIEGAVDSDLGLGRIVAVCAAVLGAVIVLRLVWVFPSRYLFRRPTVDPDTGETPPWTYTFLLGWAGMRGVVTLAAAFVIPEGTEDREVLVLIALTVVGGTLFLQGMTLPWIARTLKVPSPDPVEDALARATLLQQASKSALHRLDELEYDDRHGIVDLIRQRLDQRNFAAWERLATVEDQEAPSELYSRVRLELLQAERHRVLEIRSAGTVPAEVVADVLAMLDVEESMLDVASEERQQIRISASGRRTGETCADLDARPAIQTVEDPACQRCLEEGLHWVALRQCLTCGNIGCCDSSTGQHATAHFHDTTHPVMQSAEPGEDWRWCYVHHLTA